MSEKDRVYEVLKKLEIPYEITPHPAVYTAAEAEEYRDLLKGTRCKNLFLKNGRGRVHYLVIVPHDKMLDLRKLDALLDEKRLGFASPRRLMKYLGLTPGSVSVFGLINDEENHVRVVLDEDLQKDDKINFHPNINTETLTILYTDLIRFLEWTGNPYMVIKFE